MPASIPLVRLDHILPFTRYLARQGVPVERLMVEAGLPTEALGDPAALASAHVLYGFVELAASRAGFDDLGLRVGLELSIPDLGELGASFGPGTACASLHEALAESFSLSGAESRRMELWIEPGDAAVQLSYRGSLGLGSPGFAIVEQYMIALLVQMVRAATGPDWVPPEIHLRGGDERVLSQDSELGHARIVTGREVTAIVVPRSCLLLPLRGHEVGVVPELPVEQRHEFPADFEAALRSALRPYLCEGTPGVEVAARLAGTSTRSLQRLLAASGKSYTQVLEEVRLEVALELMSDVSMLLSDVAGELGYSDGAHFSRAFSRWTGLSPAAYRAALGGSLRATVVPAVRGTTASPRRGSEPGPSRTAGRA